MRNKVLCFILAVLMIVLPLISAEALTMAGFDGEESSHVWSENGFFSRMETRTGLSFTFDQYTSYEKWQEAKNAMFASGTLPDVLFKASLTMEEQIKYSDAGMLIDLLPLLAKNAPNLWSLLSENPEWLAAITLPSGKIAALPTINPLPLQNAMWINQTWLDTLNLDTPTDWDSLVAVLTAFQTRDPNRNGKNDEIPLSFLGPWDLKFLGHAFGIIVNDYNIYIDDLDQVRFISENESFLVFIKALRALYVAGLLDENNFYTSDQLRSVKDSKAAVPYGMFFGPTPFTLLDVTLGEQFAVLSPLEYNGKQEYRNLFGPVSTGSFAITSACENPEALLAWVDYLYTYEGALEAMVGIEDTDYAWNEEHNAWSYVLDLADNSSYILYDLSIYDTGDMPWLSPSEFIASYDTEGLQQTTNALTDFRDHTINPFPHYYVLTPAQQDTINQLQLALGAYVDESIAKFVIGELDVNSTQDVEAFYTGLSERGLQEFLLFWQEIYNRQRIR